MADFINKKRGIIDVDSEASFSNSVSISNLSALADNKAYTIPPKQVAIISLNNTADIDAIYSSLSQFLQKEISKENLFKYNFNMPNEYMFTSSIPHYIFKGKERLSLIKTQRNIYNILDICKVVDLVIFVSSCKNTDVSNWKKEPDRYSQAIDEFGYNILSILRAQGLPQHICILQDLDLIELNHRNEIKKLFNRYFDSELNPEKTFAFLEKNEDEIKAVLRHICGMNTIGHQSLDLRKHRSFLLSEKLVYQNNYLEISGYIKGNTLNVNNPVHITGFGDFQIEAIEYDNDPCAVKSHNQSKSLSMDIDIKETNSNIIQEKSKTIMIKNEILLEKNENINDGGNKPIVLDKKENENNKKKNNGEKLNDDIDKNIDNLFNIKINEDKDYDISYEENEDDILNEEEGKDENQENSISKKHLTKISVSYRKKDEMEFKDEIDTPLDISSRERLVKYKGLESFKTGTWDPNTNLPTEYSKIFHFENFKQSIKKLIKKTHEEGLKISGSYIKIKIKDFPKEELNYILKDNPLVLSTLLEHEQKVTVNHLKINTNFEYSKDINSKELYEIHIGFKRILSRPIFSLDQKIDKLKYEHSLEKDKFYFASIYCNLIYPNSPVMIFKPNREQKCQIELVAKGSVFEENSSKVILKKK